MREDLGYVHIYTGNGKGKTTAAFGLALRAAAAGLKIYVGQFVKSMRYHEVALADHFAGVTIEQLGEGCFIFTEPTKKDIAAAKAALEKAQEILRAPCAYDLVILDEVFIAYHLGMISEADLSALIALKDPAVELVLTGRYCPESLYEQADLVTEMTEIKHYYQKGQLSRPGIDV